MSHEAGQGCTSEKIRENVDVDYEKLRKKKIYKSR
jgi:hypothetical protein